MRRNAKRLPVPAALALILAIAVLGGFLFDCICTAIERQTHPRKYAEYVVVYAEAYGVPEDVIYAVIRTESHFDSAAVSRAGAVGLMQLMPETFLWLTNDMLGEHLSEAVLYDPETNIRYGTYLLSRLYTRYGDWETAAAAYNAGSGTVDEWLKDPSYTDQYGFLNRIPYKETASYVKKFSAARKTYQRLYYSK